MNASGERERGVIMRQIFPTRGKKIFSAPMIELSWLILIVKNIICHAEMAWTNLKKFFNGIEVK